MRQSHKSPADSAQQDGVAVLPAAAALAPVSLEDNADQQRYDIEIDESEITPDYAELLEGTSLLVYGVPELTLLGSRKKLEEIAKIGGIETSAISVDASDGDDRFRLTIGDKYDKFPVDREGVTFMEAIKEKWQDELGRRFKELQENTEREFLSVLESLKRGAVQGEEAVEFKALQAAAMTDVAAAQSKKLQRELVDSEANFRAAIAAEEAQDRFPSLPPLARITKPIERFDSAKANIRSKVPYKSLLDGVTCAFDDNGNLLLSATSDLPNSVNHLRILAGHLGVGVVDKGIIVETQGQQQEGEEEKKEITTLILKAEHLEQYYTTTDIDGVALDVAVREAIQAQERESHLEQESRVRVTKELEEGLERSKMGEGFLLQAQELAERVLESKRQALATLHASTPLTPKQKRTPKEDALLGSLHEWLEAGHAVSEEAFPKSEHNKKTVYVLKPKDGSDPTIGIFKDEKGKIKFVQLAVVAAVTPTPPTAAAAFQVVKTGDFKENSVHIKEFLDKNLAAISQASANNTSAPPSAAAAQPTSAAAPAAASTVTSNNMTRTAKDYETRDTAVNDLLKAMQEEMSRKASEPGQTQVVSLSLKGKTTVHFLANPITIIGAPKYVGLQYRNTEGDEPKVKLFLTDNPREVPSEADYVKNRVYVTELAKKVAAWTDANPEIAAAVAIIDALTAPAVTAAAAGAAVPPAVKRDAMVNAGLENCYAGMQAKTKACIHLSWTKKPRFGEAQTFNVYFLPEPIKAGNPPLERYVGVALEDKKMKLVLLNQRPTAEALKYKMEKGGGFDDYKGHQEFAQELVARYDLMPPLLPQQAQQAVLQPPPQQQQVQPASRPPSPTSRASSATRRVGMPTPPPPSREQRLSAGASLPYRAAAEEDVAVAHSLRGQTPPPPRNTPGRQQQRLALEAERLALEQQRLAVAVAGVSHDDSRVHLARRGDGVTNVRWVASSPTRVESFPPQQQYQAASTAAAAAASSFSQQQQQQFGRDRFAAFVQPNTTTPAAFVYGQPSQQPPRVAPSSDHHQSGEPVAAASYYVQQQQQQQQQFRRDGSAAFYAQPNATTFAASGYGQPQGGVYNDYAAPQQRQAAQPVASFAEEPVTRTPLPLAPASQASNPRAAQLAAAPTVQQNPVTNLVLEIAKVLAHSAATKPLVNIGGRLDLKVGSPDTRGRDDLVFLVAFLIVARGGNDASAAEIIEQQQQLYQCEVNKVRVMECARLIPLAHQRIFPQANLFDKLREVEERQLTKSILDVFEGRVSMTPTPAQNQTYGR